MNFGRTWWMSLITIIVQAILAALNSTTSTSTTATVAAVAGIAAVAVSHNIARAVEDTTQTKVNGGTGTPPTQKEPLA